MEQKYKPKAARTLRKMVIDMKDHCHHVSNDKFFGCHTCPYNVQLQNGFDCWFVWSGFRKPMDWEINEMGSYHVEE